MTSQREEFRGILDNLLEAGSHGEDLRACHLPHLKRARLQIALPAVLVPGCVHVAEISLDSLRIRYKEILSKEEAGGRPNLLFVPEADEYTWSHWKSDLSQSEPSLIRQTRHPSGKCTWSVFEQRPHMYLESSHMSEFMELGRRCVVTYDD